MYIQAVHDLTLSNHRVKLVKYIQAVHDLTLSCGNNSLTHPNLSHQTCCCGHWICRAVPGRITPQLSLTSGFQVRYDQLPTLDPIVCSNWICRAVPGRITLQTQPNLELAIFKFILNVMSMFNFHVKFVSSF